MDLGTLTWELYPNYTDIFRCTLPVGMKTVLNSEQAVLINPKYGQVIGTSVASVDKSIAQLHQLYLVVHDSAYSDAATFKTAMNGVYLVYELATPTTESADPYQNPQLVDKDGTEEYVTTGIVPVGHDTDYYLDADSVLTPPSTAGTYSLKVTVASDGSKSYSWVSD